MKLTSVPSPKCEEHHLILDAGAGEVFCSHCGIVIEDKMEVAQNQISRSSAVPGKSEISHMSSYDIRPSTIIGRTDVDAKGKRILSISQTAVHRLRTWDIRIRANDAKHRNLRRALLLLTTLGDKFSLPEAVIQSSLSTYKKAVAAQLVSGRSIDAILVAAVYIAVRKTDSSISLKEISEISNIRLKTVSKAVRLVLSELEISIPREDTNRYVAKIGNICGISQKTKREAINLMSSINQSDYRIGKKPVSLAASALLAASIRTGEHISQKDIAEATGITAVTLRTRLRDLRQRNLT
ncbi:MAG: transcription initiation factor IIB [Candidatus Eiseniibacteriota bacterium]